jgi:hypothetical protein
MKTESDAKACDEWEIKVARSLEEIEAVREIWDQMLRSESTPVLNADIDRYLSVVESMKEEVQPYVIVLYNDSNPKAIVIGRIEKHRIKCRIGYMTIFKPSLRCLSIVYRGILGQPSDQISSRLVQELVDTLKQGDVEVVFLNHLHIDSHLRSLSRAMPHFLCRDHFPVVEDHWQTYVPETSEEFYASIRRKRKKEWKRLSGRLEDSAGGPLKVECYNKVNQVEHFIDIGLLFSWNDWFLV